MASKLHRLTFGLVLRAVGIWKHLTLGARVAVIADRRVLLVRHGYAAGWQFPGGGVDPGETAEDAARRELVEETGFRAAGEMQLFGLYHAVQFTNRDHVALFVAEGATQERAFAPNREIAEIGWFDLGDLPDDLSSATGRRLVEIAGKAEISPRW